MNGLHLFLIKTNINEDGLYLFNGNGWGDHFLAFIKAHLREHGEKSILVIT
jgi:hypothetical protein